MLREQFLLVLLESAGILLIFSGVVYEVQTGAPFGFILISGGSLFLALGGFWVAKMKPMERVEKLLERVQEKLLEDVHEKL